MTVIEYLLDGIEAELALERELGVRFVETKEEVKSKGEEVKSVVASPRPQPKPQPRPLTSTYAIVFLHDGAMSEGGVEMMAKIFGALKLSQETTPIVTECAELPPAKVYVVMGSKARDRYFPGMHGSPGVWGNHSGVNNILITYSPEYILKQGPTITPALDKIKHEFWRGIKGAFQRAETL